MATHAQAFVKTERTPDLPPPSSTVGFVGWARANLFSSWWNTLLTLLGLYIIYLILPGLLDFAFFNAVWEGEDREACLGENVGACWPFIEAKFGQIIYGRYPDEERYRVDIAYFVGLLGIALLAIPGIPFKKWTGIFMLAVYPVMTYYLLVGGAFGMPFVDTPLWGGLLVTLVVATSGIVASLPIGILLALGRRSKMPMVRYFSVAFIEFWRGVPLITVLFMASVLLPLFLPGDLNLDKLLRALIGVALFASAYMAEVVRGGLQAIPRGQYEGAMALGLSYWRMMGLIVLPQALKMVIPGIVNTFIGLFKDTTLVLIIGLFDLLGIVQLSFTNSNWATPVTSHTGYLFVAAIFWIFCFSMSRYSIYMENKLHTGHKR